MFSKTLYVRHTTLLLTLVSLLSACAVQQSTITPGTVPTQGEVQMSDEEYGQQVFAELTQHYPIDDDDVRIERVRRIVDELTTANNAHNQIWHVYVLKGDSVKNAGATRGNYVFVWTGLLSAVQNDSELATVLAHEIAHVLAGHTNPSPAEQVNEMLSGVAGSVAREVLIGQGQVGAVAVLAGALLQETMKGFLVNPESQRKELEADQIGLFIMANAGMDPRIAVEFWKRVKDDPDFSGAPVEFLSSHPSSDTRVAELEHHLPLAIEYYNRATGVAPQKSAAKKQSAAGNSKNKSSSGNTQAVRWRARESEVFVYEKADILSRRVATLTQGEEIQALNSDGVWVEIYSPVKGYVRAVQVRRK